MGCATARSGGLAWTRTRVNGFAIRRVATPPQGHADGEARLVPVEAHACRVAHVRRVGVEATTGLELVDTDLQSGPNSLAGKCFLDPHFAKPCLKFASSVRVWKTRIGDYRWLKGRVWGHGALRSDGAALLCCGA